ncbi:hypothetical protein FGADI_5974 [Fusarium gaditjirri]|uniref:Uncharacterized protein n=1 Tax=Fusarium gaditjirri TaxID=282569 RepID=A0A8H4T962_9HYPO|nr:hypothetical protein FGADI_5974 [Fusarium gaditjirri]
MEKQLQDLKMEIMQDRLDSLECRLKELANSLTQLSAKQLSKQFISCMEAIRNLASDCLIENTDRYLDCFDRTEFFQYARGSRRAMRFDLDGDNIIERTYLEAGHHRQMIEEERRDRFMSLKAGVPPAKFCFPPNNAHELFPPPPYGSEGRGLQYRGSPHPMAAAMPGAEHSYGSGASFESIPSELSGDEESKEEHFEAWAQQQREEYGKYLQLPVTPHVISAVLSHYEDAQVGRWPLPLGLKLYRLFPAEGQTGRWDYETVVHEPSGNPNSSFNEGDIQILTTTRERLKDENWDSGSVLKRRVPTPHPLLPDCMALVERLTPEELSEFGLLVAWCYCGTKAWMDRYGHLVP